MENTPCFYTSLLLTYKETVEHGLNFLQPPPDLIDGEEEYKVEAILGHCEMLRVVYKKTPEDYCH